MNESDSTSHPNDATSADAVAPLSPAKTAGDSGVTDQGRGAVRAPSHRIAVFSAPSDAPRVRWKTDLISGGFSAALLIFLIIVAGEGSSFDRNMLEFVGGLPGWLLWFGQAAYVFGLVYFIGLMLGVAIFARDRLELLRDMLLAAALAVAVAVLLTQFIDTRWPEFAFFELDQTARTFPAFFLATAAAIQAAASPFLSAPMRKIGWTFILITALASALGAVAEVSDVAGAVLVGLLSAATIRYAFGTTAGLPSTNRVRDGLADLDVDVVGLRPSDLQLPLSVVFVGESTEGLPLFINVLGRDSWHSRRWTRLWRQAWYHDQGTQDGKTRRQLAEHAALTMLLADRAGVSIPTMVAAGMTELDDAMLVTERYDKTLRDLPVDDVDDDLLDGIWGELRQLREARLSNGRMDQTDIWIDSDGAPAISGFANAAIHANDAQLNEDVTSLLVNNTLIVGADRAIAASRRALGDDVVTAALPGLQTATLSPTLRRQAKHQKLKLADLRKQTAAALGTDVPKVEQLQRVSLASILTTLLAGFAFYSIISGLADVGFDTIAEALSDARWGLVIIALVMTQATNLTDAISAAAIAPKKIPVGVTTIEQFSISFIDLATPGNTGQIATNARFFGKFGMNPVTAMTVGAITGIISILGQAILVVLAIIAGKNSMDLSSLQTGGGVLRVLGFAVGLLVLALIVVLIIPRLRAWMKSKLKEPVAQAKSGFSQLRQPKKAALTFGGAIGTEFLYGGALALSVLATGGSISLGEAIFINVVVSLVAGLMPVPGGVGVYEAGVVAGLVSAGVDNHVAVAAVLVYRMCSFYLPPIWGYVSLRWLKSHDYL
jgi:uncharacterized membrane protein YbhN (UPF0104 family)